MATLNVASAGTYAYAYRFSGDAGTTWTYCDTSGSSTADPYSAVDQGVATIVIRADVYSGNNELAMAFVDEQSRLAQYVVEVSAPRGTSTAGNDAERAHEVAPFLHLQIGTGMNGIVSRGVDRKTRNSAHARRRCRRRRIP